MATNTKLDSLVINYLSQSQYDTAKNNGTLNANQIYMTPANEYTLPAATSSTLGGVKIGSNITVSSGTISISKADVTNALGYTPPTTDTKYTLPSATSSTLGGVKIGSNITVSSGTISLTKANVTNALGYTPPTSDTKYTLPTATNSTLGGVKLSNSTSSNSGESSGIAATPAAVKAAYDASTEWIDVSSSVNSIISTTSSYVKSMRVYTRGRRIYLYLTGNGPATSGASGFISVATIGNNYRPKVDMPCAVTINQSTTGQVFIPSTCIVKSTGEVQVITNKINTTFGNNSYAWSTTTPMCIIWDY